MRKYPSPGLGEREDNKLMDRNSVNVEQWHIPIGALRAGQLLPGQDPEVELRELVCSTEEGEEIVGEGHTVIRTEFLSECEAEREG